MTPRTLSVFALLTLVTLSALHAQVPPDTLVFRVGELVVHSPRAITTIGGASAIEIGIQTLRLRPAATLHQVLRELPFVHTRTNARGEMYFGLRGSGENAREVAVLVDGIPISLGFDHRADVGVVPVTAAHRLTLVRGLPSLLYGPNVLGGVVDIDVANRDAESAGQLHVTGGVDHTGARAVAAAVAAPIRSAAGMLLVRAGGGHRATDGFPLPRAVTEPAPFDTDDMRVNSDHDLSDGFFSMRYVAHRGIWAAVSAMAYTASRGAPAELHVSNPRFWRYPTVQRVFSVAALGTGSMASPLGGRAELQASFGFDDGRSELDGFTNRHYTTVSEQEDADDRTLTTRVLASHTVARSVTVQSAFTFADISRDELLTPGAASSYRQRLWSGALETEWRRSGLRVTLGGAWDGADTPETGGKPVVEPLHTWGARAGVVGVARGGALLVHAAASRRARFPSLRELYSGALNRVEPNPDLGPEFLRAVEAGITTQVAGVQLQAVGFHHHIADAIVRTTVDRKVKRVNRDETRSSGIELLAARTFGPASISLDMTVQTVASSDPVAVRDYRTEYQPKFAGGTRIAVPLMYAAQLAVTARATGSQYCLLSSGAYQRLAPAARAGAQVARTWLARIETAIAIDNVTNALTYDQCGLPQPGRIIRLQVRTH